MASASLVVATGLAIAADDNMPETVVVTGSRIPRPELDMPNPVQSLGAAEILHSGTTNVTDYLKRIPALQGSLGDIETSGLNSGSTDAGSSLGGLNLLNLRNLGFDRTLVLEDGQRIVGSSTGDTGVDINTIPITLIDRVDVVTGGSSAVYGADGVTGVVNFVMKHDLEGIDARAQAGGPQDGGAGKYFAAVSVGHNFDDGKGNIELTYEFGMQDQLNYTQRSFTRVGGAIFFVPNPANIDGSDKTLPANIPTKQGTIFSVSGRGAIDTDLDFNPDFNSNGTPFNPGNPIDGEFALGGDGLPTAAAFNAGLIPNQHRHIAQATGDYEFSHWFKLTGEFRFAHVDTSSMTEPSYYEGYAVTDQNPFLPQNVKDAITANGTAGLGPDGSAIGLLFQFPYNIPGAPIVENVSRETYRANFGAGGDLPAPDIMHDAKWSVNFVYGQTDIRDNIMNNLVQDRFAAALDSVVDPATGKPTCRSNLEPGTTPANPGDVFGPDNAVFDFLSSYPTSGYPLTFTPGPNSGCAPLNIFDPKANNKQALAFAFPTLHNTGFLSQYDVNGYVSWNFPQIKDWGFDNPISVVLGGEYRREASSSFSPAISTTPSLYFFSGASPVKGNFDVSEAFGELSLPLLSDRSWANELTLDFAGRVSSYSTAGTDETWKLGLVYSPIPGLKLRASDAVAVRAPNIGELFAPQQALFDQINDPCDPENISQGTQFRLANCQKLIGALVPGYVAGVTKVQNASTVPTNVGGNPLLAPETARTYTIGVVVQPDMIPGLAVTVDYYRVSITNAIEAPTAQDVADQCVDLSTINNPFCGQIQRRTTSSGGANSPAGGISLATSTQINVALFYTAGEDFTVAYHSELDDYFGDDSGTLDLHLTGNHLDKLATTPLPGEAPTDSSGTVGSPFWQLNVDALWSIDNWTIDYNWQWYTGTLNFLRQTVESEPNVVAPQYLHSADQNEHDIQIGYQVSPALNVYGGVENIFYQKPSPNDAGQGIPVSPIGRFFYAGVRFNTDDLGL